MEQPDSEKHVVPTPPNRGRIRRFWLIFFAILLAALILHRCQREPPPPSTTLPEAAPERKTSSPSSMSPALPESAQTTHVADAPAPVPPALKPPRVPVTVSMSPPQSVPNLERSATLPRSPPDSAPYIYADPWGGRHFDSVKVTLHCRENCAVIFSLKDSVHFQSYQEQPFTFRRNTTLWISGIDAKGRQLDPARIDYVIEKNPGACKDNGMPVPSQGKTVCMDRYEWPNQEGEQPLASVSWREAADFCAGVGKRLCALDEWRAACRGPDREAYPYGGEYNERHCPAKETAAARSGRFPACRSYYGVYDMTGNVWEWTSTPSRDRDDFFMVAGGNWDAGDNATCSLSKFSFYPQNRYPFVGFRCCQDAAGP